MQKNLDGSMNKIHIITGASRGLGLAIAQQSEADGIEVLSLSRSQSPVGEHLVCDLSRPDHIAEGLNQRFAQLAVSDYDEIVLINNAGMLEPIRPYYSGKEAHTNLNVNFISHVVVTQAFLQAFESHSAVKQILNISSGAAVNPYHGWSLYCAAKAGLEHFGRCVALEQEEAEFPCWIANINPGVMDTEMQKTIRESKPDDFPSISKFTDLHRDGALPSTESIAAFIGKGLSLQINRQGKTLSAEAFSQAV